MKINCFSVTFWFNIFTEHADILKDFNGELKDEYANFTIASDKEDNNLLTPVITAYNKEKKSNLLFTKINLQYSIEDTTFENFHTFKETVLKIFEILDTNNIAVLHTALFINAEELEEKALATIAENLLNKKVNHSSLVDVNVKLAKNYDEQFYQFISLANKKQLQFPKKYDELGRLVPIPLIPWQEALEEKDILEIIFEINDKYSFDFTKNYHTTEFYLNKMLYIMENDFTSNIEELIQNGGF